MPTQQQEQRQQSYHRRHERGGSDDHMFNAIGNMFRSCCDPSAEEAVKRGLIESDGSYREMTRGLIGGDAGYYQQLGLGPAAAAREGRSSSQNSTPFFKKITGKKRLHDDPSFWMMRDTTEQSSSEDLDEVPLMDEQSGQREYNSQQEPQELKGILREPSFSRKVLLAESRRKRIQRILETPFYTLLFVYMTMYALKEMGITFHFAIESTNGNTSIFPIEFDSKVDLLGVKAVTQPQKLPATQEQDGNDAPGNNKTYVEVTRNAKFEQEEAHIEGKKEVTDITNQRRDSDLNQEAKEEALTVDGDVVTAATNDNTNDLVKGDKERMEIGIHNTNEDTIHSHEQSLEVESADEAPLQEQPKEMAPNPITNKVSHNLS